MVLVRKIHRRGANIVVEANAEVLFAATGDVGRWQNRFSHRVRSAAGQEAPTNKRPRWAHYGKPLKDTMTATTRYQPGRMKVYSAVGSTAPHAYYVDQGTGIYNGSSPWKAKVLPPYREGSPSLYEHTWRPGGPPNATVAPVMIRGQKGQHFFDRALARGFQSMRMRSYQVPGEGASGMASAIKSAPSGLANFLGNTPADAGFIASLQEWRAWRDEAFNSGKIIGRNQGLGTRESQRRAIARGHRAQQRRAVAEIRKARRAQASKARSQERRDRLKALKDATNEAKNTDKGPKTGLTRGQDKSRVKALAIKKFGARNIISIEWDNGRWEIVVRTFTIREADGQMRPDFKVYHIKARSS